MNFRGTEKTPGTHQTYEDQFMPPHYQDDDDLQAVYDVDGAIKRYQNLAGRPTTIDSKPGMDASESRAEIGR